jgi:hypothetical protein
LCILFPAVCDGTQELRHRDALILAPRYGRAWVGVGILGGQDNDKTEARISLDNA